VREAGSKVPVIPAREENVGGKSGPTKQSKNFRAVSSMSQLLQQTQAANPAPPQTTGALEVI